MGKYQKKGKATERLSTLWLCCLIIAIPVIIATAWQSNRYKAQIEEINANHEQEITNLRAEMKETYETQIAELKQFYEYGGDVSQIEREAEYIAKVIYGTARNHAASDKRAVVWCILNRVEHYAHPNTIEGVCEQPKQWMSYSSDNPVLTENYELALEELKIWYGGGHRPMGNEYIYLTWSSKEILLRDTYEETRATNYWRMK